MPQYKLYYMALRARGEPIRMMFALTDVPYEEIVCKFEDWKELHTDFPFWAVPVLEVDGVKIPQTVAILRFLADQYGFGGTNPVEKALVEAVALQDADLRKDYTQWHIVNAGYVAGDKDALYEQYKPVREKHFTLLENMLKKSESGWFVGDSITYADLMVATDMEMLQTLDPAHEKIFDGHPELKKHMDKVLNYPKLKQHMDSRPEYRY